MFERFTEKARRTIFFARYEASQYGSPSIGTEHLLLGLLREDQQLARRLMKPFGSLESLRAEIATHIARGERIATSVEMPLSPECRRILSHAAEEAARLGHKHVGTEHLLLGILGEPECLAAQVLTTRGLDLDKLRVEFATKVTTASAQPGEPAGASILRLAPLLAAWSAGDAKKFAQDFHPQAQFTDMAGVSGIGGPAIEEAVAKIFAIPGWKKKKWYIQDVQLVSNLAIVIVFSGGPGGAEPQPGEMRMILILKQFSEGWLVLKVEVSVTGTLPSEGST